MANFKRKRSRSNTRGRVKHMSSWPAWWDLLFHRRPVRREASAIANAVRRGEIDPDDATWPLSKKPHQYYW